MNMVFTASTFLYLLLTGLGVGRDPQGSPATESIGRDLTLVRELSPWDDPNYALDESWARFFPYSVQASHGETARCVLKLMNHSARTQVFRIRIHLPKGWTLQSITPEFVRVPPRQEGSVEVLFVPPRDPLPIPSLMTADIQWDKADLREWTEAMVLTNTGRVHDRR